MIYEKQRTFIRRIYFLHVILIQNLIQYPPPIYRSRSVRNLIVTSIIDRTYLLTLSFLFLLRRPSPFIICPRRFCGRIEAVRERELDATAEGFARFGERLIDGDVVGILISEEKGGVGMLNFNFNLVLAGITFQLLTHSIRWFPFIQSRF